MSLIKRNKMGRLAQLIVEINDKYESLEEHALTYSQYDGGQPNFTETEMYKEMMGEIVDLEKEMYNLLPRKGELIRK